VDDDGVDGDDRRDGECDRDRDSRLHLDYHRNHPRRRTRRLPLPLPPRTNPEVVRDRTG